MKIMPAKGLNKWENTKIQESPLGIPSILISKYGLHPFIKYLMEEKK